MLSQLALNTVKMNVMRCRSSCSFPSRGKAGMGARTLAVLVYALAPTLALPRQVREQYNMALAQ